MLYSVVKKIYFTTLAVKTVSDTKNVTFLKFVVELKVSSSVPNFISLTTLDSHIQLPSSTVDIPNIKQFDYRYDHLSV
jgi:hypothetical protein